MGHYTRTVVDWTWNMQARESSASQLEIALLECEHYSQTVASLFGLDHQTPGRELPEHQTCWASLHFVQQNDQYLNMVQLRIQPVL